MPSEPGQSKTPPGAKTRRTTPFGLAVLPCWARSMVSGCRGATSACSTGPSYERRKTCSSTTFYSSLYPVLPPRIFLFAACKAVTTAYGRRDLTIRVPTRSTCPFDIPLYQTLPIDFSPLSAGVRKRPKFFLTSASLLLSRLGFLHPLFMALTMPSPTSVGTYPNSFYNDSESSPTSSKGSREKEFPPPQQHQPERFERSIKVG